MSTPLIVNQVIRSSFPIYESSPTIIYVAYMYLI
jgi:hypothetical protein